MMPDFEVYYEWCSYCGFSKVYYIDAKENNFLVVNKFGDFMWVSISNCKIKFPIYKKESKND